MDGGRTFAQQAVRRDPVDTRRELGIKVASRVDVRDCRHAAVVEGDTELRDAWVCIEAAVAFVGSRLPVASAEAAGVVFFACLETKSPGQNGLREAALRLLEEHMNVVQK
jgi:hypothetical protein